MARNAVGSLLSERTLDEITVCLKVTVLFDSIICLCESALHLVAGMLFEILLWMM